MKNIQIFRSNKFGEVRVAKTENNDPLFCLADVCKILDIDNPRQVKTRLNSEGMALIDLQQLNKNGVINNDGVIINKLGNTKATFVNESNFYKVVFQSRKPEAEEFTDWVTSEVLPSIRKHGAYLTDTKIEEVLTSPDTIIKLATQLKEERVERERLRIENEVKQQQIINQNLQMRKAKPKIEYFDEVLQSKSTYTTNQIAKELGMSAQGLNKFLNKQHIQYKESGTWLLYSYYQNKGFTKSKTYTYYSDNGTPMTSMQTVWTEKGREFIHRVFKKHFSVYSKTKLINL